MMYGQVIVNPLLENLKGPYDIFQKEFKNYEKLQICIVCTNVLFYLFFL